MANQVEVEKAYAAVVIQDAAAAALFRNPILVEKAYVAVVIRQQPVFSIDPDGVTLNIAGAIPGTYPVKIRVTDSNADTFEKTFNIVITD